MDSSTLEKIEEIDKRLKKLEQKEKKRQIASILKTVVFLVIVVAFSLFAIHIYQEVQPIISSYQEMKNKYDDSNINQFLDKFLK